MVVYKRKKNSRLRGSKTHGWGAMKKHRGAGNRGGRGKAGTGKRGDSKKPSIWANPRYFGKYGFIPKNSVKYNPVNISFLEEKLASLVASGMAKESSGGYAVNLKELGFNKLLSGGKATRKYVITAPYASKNAVEKIRSAGGDVVGLLAKREKVQKKEAKETVQAEAPKS
jgi:large subunit ribosomal protein L15